MNLVVCDEFPLHSEFTGQALVLIDRTDHFLFKITTAFSLVCVFDSAVGMPPAAT